MIILYELISKISKLFYLLGHNKPNNGQNSRHENGKKYSAAVKQQPITNHYSLRPSKARKNASTNRVQSKKNPNNSGKTLELTIKHNIFYLNQLKDVFVKIDVAHLHINKINDLIEQSEGNIRILYKLNPKAPYYISTIAMIKSHTLVIHELIATPVTK